ncbi:Uncharacterized phage-associated protein [Deinococcus reticulitermitis]|uniref:Uncharacterized phage-associated protein n=1 Tax=Deinococcus reticulitermitis TaxID=856736 RepID=A0A1H7BD48_9DEIO|nr:type II toxin-antitoxin system antitoxin SocA domain-containing protein [Deinococcus reticulitermitis]SEJ75583.1 Uncharacterized phage-associated protein [Deinococcus reticulitermitis]
MTDLQPAYPAEKVANRLLELAARDGRLLTHMQLQKLLYFAHGLSLGLHGRRLVRNNFHAWPHGPVSPALYRKLEAFGASPVDRPLPDPQPELALDADAAEVLERTYAAYGHMDGWQLREISHLPGSPWDVANTEEPYSRIPDSLSERYYREQLREAAGEDAL